MWQKTPENDAQPKLIINYFLAFKDYLTRFPDDFNVLCQLGQGAFGEVKLVKLNRNKRIYALKIMKKLNERELKAVLRFDDHNYGSNNNVIREILLMKNLRDVYKLKHPNIIELENYWYSPDQEGNYRFFILM